MGTINPDLSGIVDGAIGDAADWTTPMNTIINAINGNINSANIASSGVATANIASSAITTAKLDSNIKSGWFAVSDTWTYASASTITVPTDATATYQSGDKIRWKQGGSYKYGVIKTVAATLITILVNTDYTVANSAITDIYYSRADSPFGYPEYFNVTPTVETGFTPGNATLVGKISTKGKEAHYWGLITWGSTTSSSTVMDVVTPLPADTATTSPWGVASTSDSSSGLLYLAVCDLISASTIGIFNNNVTQRIAGNYSTPFTFASGDAIRWDITYPIA